MALIDGQHCEAKRQRSGTNQEIGKRNHDPAALLFRVQLAGQPLRDHAAFARVCALLSSRAS